MIASGYAGGTDVTTRFQGAITARSLPEPMTRSTSTCARLDALRASARAQLSSFDSAISPTLSTDGQLSGDARQQQNLKRRPLAARYSASPYRERFKPYHYLEFDQLVQPVRPKRIVASLIVAGLGRWLRFVGRTKALKPAVQVLRKVQGPGTTPYCTTFNDFYSNVQR
jgi:hypothetical protein